MKVLFVDVDGVLNNRRTIHEATDYVGLDKEMCFHLGRIKLHTGCELVMSSSWRFQMESVADVEKAIGYKFYARTPLFTAKESEFRRGEEIREWLFSHRTMVGWDGAIERLAILDDDNDFYPEQQPFFFKTSFEVGLTREIADAVIKHLNS